MGFNKIANDEHREKNKGEENSKSGRLGGNKQPVPFNFTKELHFVFQIQVSSTSDLAGCPSKGLQRRMKISIPLLPPRWIFHQKLMTLHSLSTLQFSKDIHLSHLALTLEGAGGWLLIAQFCQKRKIELRNTCTKYHEK